MNWKSNWRCKKENHLRVDVGGMPVELQEKGLYDFDADHNVVRVFDGRAAVLQGTHETHVLGGHEMVLNADKLKARKASTREKLYEDDMYRWSKLQSSYIAEANIEMARTYYGGGESYYNGECLWFRVCLHVSVVWLPGWYWDPWFFAYHQLPGDGGTFWNPWGASDSTRRCSLPVRRSSADSTPSEFQSGIPCGHRASRDGWF